MDQKHGERTIQTVSSGKDIEKKSNFQIDAITSYGASNDAGLKSLVYKKDFTSIEELKSLLESKGYQMGVPKRLNGSGSNNAQIDVAKNGKVLCTLGLLASQSLEVPYVAELGDGSTVRIAPPKRTE